MLQTIFNYAKVSVCLKTDSIILNKYIKAIYYLKTTNIELIRKHGETLKCLYCLFDELVTLPHMPNCNKLWCLNKKRTIIYSYPSTSTVLHNESSITPQNIIDYDLPSNIDALHTINWRLYQSSFLCLPFKIFHPRLLCLPESSIPSG